MAELKKNTMNQILFVMVDGTDFASIKSTLGAASVAGRLFGVTHGGSVAVVSAAISKACSLVRSGIFRQTLKAAECNYDYCTYRFTATGCADQVMAFQMVTNNDVAMYSELSNINSIAIKLNSRVTKAVANNSQLSDLASDLRSVLMGMSDTLSKVYVVNTQANSRLLVNQSVVSDVYSQLSDFRSVVLNYPSGGVVISPSSLSDIGSRVWADAIGSDIYSRVQLLNTRITKTNASASQLLIVQSMAHPAQTYGSTATSRALLCQSMISDVYSQLSDFRSVALAYPSGGLMIAPSAMSDLRSAITAAGGGAGATASQVWVYATRALTASPLTVSDISDIGSRVWADAIGSDLYSKIGTLASRVTKAPAAQSLLSHVYSDLLSNLAATATASDIGSAVWAQHYPAHGLASSFGSLFRTGMSNVSDVQSSIDSSFSNLLSLLTVTGVQANTSTMSDLRSAITAASSDLRSVASALKNLTVSTISDIGSRVWGELVSAHAISGSFGSRFNAVASNVSDIQSAIDSSFSDLLSLLTVTGTQANASTMSDLRSAITAAGGGAGATASQVWGYSTRKLTSMIAATISASDISDIGSQVWANAIGSDLYSKVGKLTSRVTKAPASNSQLSDLISNVGAYLAGMSGMDSDIYSLLSDFKSDFQSRVPKAVATNSQLSDLHSDLKSYLAGMSGMDSDIYSLLSDFRSDFQSRVPKAVATNSQLSDLHSDLKSYMAGMSDAISKCRVSVSSDYSDIKSAINDTHSDLRSYLVGMSGMESDIQSDVQNLCNALVNKQVIAKATGTVTLYDDVNNFAGTVPTAYTSTASDVTRTRLVP
jgi:uncharacterized protein YeeX (DUF496 family)